eukprot:3608149-Alexandrium_andersonii.AAC.1
MYAEPVASMAGNPVVAYALRVGAFQCRIIIAPDAGPIERLFSLGTHAAERPSTGERVTPGHRC